jgi:hypothetical protein
MRICKIATNLAPEDVTELASSFGWYEQDDDFLYHVTSRPNADSIVQEGFLPNTTSTVKGGFYQEYSKNKTFFTDRSGVKFWMSRIEDHLSHTFDDPPEVAILRIPKTNSNSKPDEVGTNDAGHPAWYINH